MVFFTKSGYKNMSREKIEISDANYPAELWEQIGARLDDNSYLSFTLSCRFFSQLNQSQRNKPRLERLLSYVAAGQQDKLTIILKKHPEFLLQKGMLTDDSGRHFPAISIFQYAVWAWDTKYMAGMIIDCIPDNEHGEKIKFALLQQLEELENEGLVYHLDGPRHCEPHFNLESIKEKLSIYIDQYFNHQNINNHPIQNALNQAAQDESHKEKWLELGKVQKYLPVYIRHEYCRLDSDEPSLKTFPRTLVVKTMDDQTCMNWDSRLNELGETFAIFKSPEKGRGAYAWKGFDDYGRGLAIDNLEEINLIHTTRKNDLILLKDKLQARDERELANDSASSSISA